MSVQLLHLYQVFEESFGKEKATVVVDELDALVNGYEKETEEVKNDFELKKLELIARIDKMQVSIEDIHRDIVDIRRDIEEVKLEIIKSKTTTIFWFLGIWIATFGVAVLLRLLKLI